MRSTMSGRARKGAAQGPRWTSSPAPSSANGSVRFPAKPQLAKRLLTKFDPKAHKNRFWFIPQLGTV